MSHCPQTTLCIILSYLAAINVVTFFLFGIDKWKAKRSKRRIEESTLIWWAAAILIAQVAIVCAVILISE